MAPKAKANAAAKKSDKEKKAKKAEDLTFGLKNKNKSKKVQKYVAQVQHQVMSSGPGASKKMTDAHAEQKAAKQAKEAELARKRLLAAVAASDDKKKTDLDPNKAPKTREEMKEEARINLFVDMRIQSNRMTEEELQAHIKGTKIVCKDFIQACESSLYGWNWKCPNNGDMCIYKHGLPQGYVLKKDVKKAADNDDDETWLETWIDQEIATMTTAKTPVNEETFRAWEEKRLQEKVQAATKGVASDKKQTTKAPDKTVKLTGKELFSFNPNLFQDDDAAIADVKIDESYIDSLANQEVQREHAELMKTLLEEAGDEVELDDLDLEGL